LLRRIATKQLESLRHSQPFFQYLHFNDPHRPYYPPRPFQKQFSDDLKRSAESAAEFSMAVHEQLMEHIATGCEFSAEDWQTLTAMYDGELAHVDQQVGAIFEWIQEADFGDTVVVITADHGEAFGEHGMLGHKVTLHDAIVNVPLVVSGFTELEIKQDEIVQHADVMRTFLDVVGADSEGMQGIDLREETRDFSIIQRSGVQSHIDEILARNPEFDIEDYLHGQVDCVRTAEYKYLRDRKREKLYRVGDETENLLESEAAVADGLSQTLTEWMDQHKAKTPNDTRAAFTEEMEQQLEYLGYL
jgi:uncharacterized sulfatase